MQVRKLMALAFAPLPLVRNTFDIMEVNADPRLAPLFAYFRQQWIVNIPPRMWNVYKVNTRTNNDLEGWHLRFANIVSRHRPNLWHLLACLQQEQVATEIILQQVAAGQNVQSKNNRYKKIHKQLKVLLRRYRRGQLSLSKYITGVSHNLAAFS
jgi:hypothetical protein